MDLEKIIAHQSQLTKWTDDAAERRKAALELVSAIGEFYDVYKRHGAQKQLLALPAAKVINGYVKLAVVRGLTSKLYMHEEAVFEAEETGLDGGVEGALMESLMYLQAGISFNCKSSPFTGAADALGTTNDQFCFGMSWFVAYITLRIGIGYDFGEYDGEELENLYFEYHAVRPTLLQEEV